MSRNMQDNDEPTGDATNDAGVADLSAVAEDREADDGVEALETGDGEPMSAAAEGDEHGEESEQESDELADPRDSAANDDRQGLRELHTEPHQPELPNIDDIPVEPIVDAIEANIFAAGEPVETADIKHVLERSWAGEHEAVRTKKQSMFREAMKLLKHRWAEHGENRGFGLYEVADGLTFRSNPRYSNYLRVTREERPVRLSKPALETLAIIAYRQPVTKPEIDHIRGVDCGGTIRILLDRDLARIVGKREEPGRPMLYGTTREFLSFFNMPSLSQLPSLREFTELSDESQDEVNALGAPTLEELSQKAKKLRLDEEPAVAALDEAVLSLDSTETKTRDAFASQGITIDPAAAEQAPEAPQQSDVS